MKFAQKLEKLDAILNKLEQEKVSIEDSLTLFEQGVSLLKDCRATLKDVEQKITLLVDEMEDGE